MRDPEIIYEDSNIIVVNKPAGLMVHGVKLHSKRRTIGSKAIKQEPTLVDWLLARYPELAKVGDDPEQRPGIVHRLDKGTSGVMLVARNQKTFERLKRLFQEHRVAKTYLAWVSGELKKKKGIVDAPIGILTGSTRRSIHSDKMAKEAVTEYKVLEQAVDGAGQRINSLLEVCPKTGRTHQIRVHLASIGHPILGDSLYGPNRHSHSALPRLMLHALSIEFPDEQGKCMRFEAEPPSDFTSLSA